MPALVAAFLATKYSDFRWYLALLAMIGVAFAHLSLNLFDDYFDYKNAQQGDRGALEREGFRARTVKCPDLQNGTVTPKQWLLACIIFGLIACAFGLPILIIRGIRILFIVLAVAVIGIFYSAPPLKLGYHGLGEIIIGLIFGPALGIGMSIAAAGEFHASEVFLSSAIGVLVVNILYVHSVMDYAADQKAGKKTLAWLVGPKKEELVEETVAEGEEPKKKADGRYVALGIINFLPYLLVIAGIIFARVSAQYIICILALPWTVALYVSMWMFKINPFGPVEKKWWYGSFPLWDQIVENKIDWFMLRWYLAQNISTVFSILCILSAIIDMMVKMMSL
ncbi:MAG: prenyltransferase [Lachnospiraceae bacterium]|nr:prenyltransferase [Lachnospiraceae bacterium]